MKKKDLNELVENYKAFLNSRSKINASEKDEIIYSAYAGNDIQVDDVRVIAKLTKGEVFEKERFDKSYNVEFSTIYKGVKFCSIHNSEEL